MPISAKRLLLSFAALLFTVLLINSCKHKPQIITSDSGYPEAIAKIFETKCISCHNATNNLGSLNMETWDRLFDGGGHGAAIVPFDIEYSPLLYYINTDSNRGPVATPTMPFDPNTGNPPNPLSTEDYNTIRDWIASGAPDKNGVVPFSANPATRQKFYIAEQGCDLLSVVDAERKVMMRNIRIGDSLGIESPHNVKVSKDGKHAYVMFYNSLIQKVDAATDKVIGQVRLINDLNVGQWNVIHLADNDSLLMASDLTTGRLRLVRTADMQVVQEYNNGLLKPHGITSNAAFDTFYVTNQYGNMVYRVTRAGQVRQILLNGKLPTISSQLDPHEIQMSPDYSKFFVTCEFSNEVRVVSVATGKVIDSFNVPTKPQEMAISKVKPYLFVSCMEDASQGLSYKKGSIVVINYNTNQIVTTLYGDFYQPHGVAVDDDRQLLMVVSRNRDNNGPAPHHTTSCGGNSGWYNFFDINNNFEKVPASGRKYEVMTDPYSVDVRFKK